MTPEAVACAMRHLRDQKDNEILRLRAKIHLIGGMCGAPRYSTDILRDIAKMCAEELCQSE